MVFLEQRQFSLQRQESPVPPRRALSSRSAAGNRTEATESAMEREKNNSVNSLLVA